MRRAIFAAVAVMLLALGAQAQFIGYVSPQTVQQVLATGATCTGAAQTYSVSNLGQTQHFLSVSTATALTLSAQLQGVDASGTSYPISDVMEIPSASPTRKGTVFGTGYFPIIQAVIACSIGSTFTASYSGTWASSPGTTGAYLTAQIDKINFTGAPGNANISNTFQTPFGNSGGTLFFDYPTISAAGGSLTLTCQSVGLSGGSVQILSVPLANVTAIQAWPVPNLSCIYATVAYTNSGSGGTVTAEYVFAPPGAAPPAFGYTHVTGTTAVVVKATAGLVHTVNVNTGAVGTFSLFDLASASCSGTPATNIVAVITATAATLQTFIYDTNFVNGICVKASLAMDVTVSSQ